ncbi:head-tail connector protein [Gordonia phage Petra]|uniref:Uncharacterized protein n=1 Tax=Gordonia phage Petra TaxID=2182347 RepID=A0A2U8UKJ5_9CAUD|nr:head-tail connector protein [Gordonia phage Petra]AWN04120.1 hypothetical protein PBI_PETRA_7 [Gordonia phage Petra]
MSPPESEVPRLLRAKAIITPEAVAAAEAAEAAALEAEEEAAAAAAAQAEALAQADADAQVEPTEPTEPAAQTAPVEPVEPTQAGAAAVVEPPVTEPVTQSTGQVKKPLKTAPVKKWEDYAVTQGMERAEAEAHTKDQLIGKFG